MWIVKTKRGNVVTYLRPSVKAIQATTYKKPGQVMVVHPSIKGWFEIRRIDEGGENYAEFIEGKEVSSTLNIMRKDVRDHLKFLIPIAMNRIKSIMINRFRRVLAVKNN